MSTPQVIGLLKWLQVKNFYDGLIGQPHIIIDAAMGGVIMRKIEDEEFSLLEEMASIDCQWLIERLILKRKNLVWWT